MEDEQIQLVTEGRGYYQEWVKNNAKIEGAGLKPNEVADAVAYVVSTPDFVAIIEIIIRPTKQVV